MGQDTLKKIKQYHQEVEKHHESAAYKIWAYYHEPKVTDYENAPHDQQLKQAAAYIDMAITKVGTPGDGWKDRNVSTEWLQRRDWSRQMAADLLYGIALELIVSAVHLKLDTRYFASYLADKEETPNRWNSKDRLIDDLRDDIPNTQLNEIEATLEFAIAKRDNLAHFGYHYHGSPNFSELFVTIAGYLIDRYADTNKITELKRMAEYLDLLDQQQTDSGDYPELSVDFRPVT